MRWGPCKPTLLLAPVCCLAAALQAQGLPGIPAVALRESVSIRQPRIRLSDLLPAGADERLRQAAAAVDLGRAPEPASFRVFTAEELRRRGVSKLRVHIAEKVVVHADGFPVEISTVRRALAEQTPSVFAGAEVSLPLEVVTRTANPALRVVRLEPGADTHSAIAIMKCQARTECGTFVARVGCAEPIHWGGTEQKERANAGRAASQTSLVRPGRPASLVFDEAGMRITMPVFPLRRAAMGESVRVLDKASRRIYFARVSGEDQVVTHFEGKDFEVKK